MNTKVFLIFISVIFVSNSMNLRETVGLMYSIFNDRIPNNDTLRILRYGIHFEIQLYNHTEYRLEFYAKETLFNAIVNNLYHKHNISLIEESTEWRILLDSFCKIFTYKSAGMMHIIRLPDVDA